MITIISNNHFVNICCVSGIILDVLNTYDRNCLLTVPITLCTYTGKRLHFPVNFIARCSTVRFVQLMRHSQSIVLVFLEGCLKEMDSSSKWGSISHPPPLAFLLHAAWGECVMDGALTVILDDEIAWEEKPYMAEQKYGRILDLWCLVGPPYKDLDCLTLKSILFIIRHIDIKYK